MKTKSKQKNKKKLIIKDKSNQVYCFNCNGMRIQILLITSFKNKTTLDILCLDCGLLQALTLKHKTNTIYQEDEEKSKSKYIG